MTAWQLPWKWLALCLATVLAIAGLALLPRLLFDSTSLQQRVAAEFSDWTGGEVRLTGPLTVRYFPNVSMRGRLEIKGGAGAPWLQSLNADEVRITLDLPDLLRGRLTIVDLRIFGPRIVLGDPSEAPQSLEEPHRLLAQFFGGGAVQRLVVRDGEIRFRTGGKGQRITEFDARLRLTGRKGLGSGSGSFVWRGEKVRYFAEWGSPMRLAESDETPLTINVTSNPLTATMGGRLVYEDGMELAGHGSVSAPDLRAFLNWTGMQLPEDRSLRDFSVRGAFTLSGSILSFDDVALTLDGNDGVGVLALAFGGERPRLEGTLDFERLALDPYLASLPTVSDEDESGPSAWSPFGWTLLRHFDADLRISATVARIGNANLGQGALSLALNQSVLSGELSEVEVCGGLGIGSFRVDASTIVTRVRLNARILDLALKPCSQQLPITILSKGTATVELRLQGEGRDEAELLRSLAGQLKIAAKNGSIPIDLATVIQKQAGSGDLWSEKGATAYTSLASSCALDAGRIKCRDFDMQTPDATVSGYGEIDLPEQTLDWFVFVSGKIISVAAPTLGTENRVTVSIRGPWSQPTIRRTVRFGDWLGDFAELAGAPNLRQASGSTP